jgi:hypothetical protein
MPFKNEYVPPRDVEGTSEFIRKALAESKVGAEERRIPHPLEHYSAQKHCMSSFVIDARDKLRTGHGVWDMWTIDHELEMVLMHVGGGREDAPYDDHWEFIDSKGQYHITTTKLAKSSPQPQVLDVTYRMTLLWSGGGYSVPDADSLHFFRQALDERLRYSLFDFNAYPKRSITLIDGRTGAEI